MLYDEDPTPEDFALDAEIAAAMGNGLRVTDPDTATSRDRIDALRDHYGQEELDDLEGLGGPGDAPKTPSEAIATERKWSADHTFVGVGYCLKNQRTAFGVGPLYMSAAESWGAAEVKRRVANGAACPRGVFAYWTGGSQGYGHIALSVGDGLCLTNDFAQAGYFSLAKIDDITARWGQTFVGWSPFVNDVRCWTPDREQPPPPPVQKDPRETPRLDELVRELGRARAQAVRIRVSLKDADRRRVLAAIAVDLRTSIKDAASLVEEIEK